MFLTYLVMSFAVQLVSDFVFTPNVLRQRHESKVTPPPVTCVVLIIMMLSRNEQHDLFHCVNPRVITLRRKDASLFP